MTRFNPYIKVQELKLYADGAIAYNQTFHFGINILRSEKNSCGKSTIMDFIYFLLGGDVPDWTDAAKSIDFGLLEISANDKVLTFKRERTGEAEPPIYIFAGSLNDAESTNSGWTKYGHKRTEKLRSFSQIFFELLGLPEHRTSLDDNITFNQLLRLIYCDQETSVNRIYRNVRFDKETTRRSVIELLLAVDDFQLHSKRQQLAVKAKELSEINGSIKSLSETLSQIYKIEEFEDDVFDSEINRLEREIESIEAEVEAIINKEAESRKVSKAKEIAHLQSALIESKKNVGQLKQELAAISFEIEDSTQFLESLVERKDALGSAHIVSHAFGAVDFKFCPLCLSPIQDSQHDSCSLCKTKSNSEEKSFNRLKAKNEIEFQFRESKALLEKRKEKKQEIQSSIESTQKQIKKLEREYKIYAESPSYVDAELRKKLNQIGYNERKIEDLVKNKQLGRLLLEKKQEKAQIASDISILETDIELLQSERAEKWEKSINSIRENIKSILKQDTGVEDAFKDPKNIEVLFDKDKVLVDGNSKFSASSEVILKNSLFLSLLKLSISEESLRYPRFLLLDNIEDKGMLADRSHNFQKIIFELSSSSQVDHQIIFTTSMIEPSLDTSDYCIGPKYDPNHKTLKIIKHPLV